MTGDELKQTAITLFGERGWQSALARHLGVDRTQIWRYVTKNRVPRSRPRRGDLLAQTRATDGLKTIFPAAFDRGLRLCHEPVSQNGRRTHFREDP